MRDDAFEHVLETLDLDESQRRFMQSRWLATLQHLERKARRLRRRRRALWLVSISAALSSVVLLAVGLASATFAQPAMWAFAVRGGRAVSGDAVARADDPTQLLHVDMQQLARPLPLIADDRAAVALPQA
jgi:hypothetical protein